MLAKPPLGRAVQSTTDLQPRRLLAVFLQVLVGVQVSEELRRPRKQGVFNKSAPGSSRLPLCV